MLFNPDHHGNIYFFGFKHILNLLNWYVIYFLAKPATITSFKVIKEFLRVERLKLVLICLFPVSVLMLLLISATDWLRFAGYFIGLMMFTSIYCDKDKFINSYISHINSFSHLKYFIFISSSLMIPAIGTYTHIFRVFF